MNESRVGHLPGRQPIWVELVDRIVAHIGIVVDVVGVSDRIDLIEPPQRWVIDPSLVVVGLRFWDLDLAGVAVA